MKIGMVGLGKMGSNMVRRLMRAGHECVVYDINSQLVDALKVEGAVSAESYADLVSKLSQPSVVWVMVPAGSATDTVLLEVASHLKESDILIDGGNSNFKDSIRRAKELSHSGIRFLDVGTSGGVWGESRGYCLMIGGVQSAFEIAEPIFKSLAPTASDSEVKGSQTALTASYGYLYCGKAGAGHFVKMIHNGIEYGMMQSLAEGFDILKAASSSNDSNNAKYDFDLAQIAEVWRKGSVVSSWLLDLVALSLSKSPELSEFEGSVADSGEGRWTVETAIEENVPAPVLTSALFARFRSRQSNNFGEKLLSAMRNNFGGHKEAKRRGPL